MHFAMTFWDFSLDTVLSAGSGSLPILIAPGGVAAVKRP